MHKFRTPSGKPASQPGMTDEEVKEWEDWSQGMSAAEAHDRTWAILGIAVMLASGIGMVLGLNFLFN